MVTCEAAVFEWTTGSVCGGGVLAVVLASREVGGYGRASSPVGCSVVEGFRQACALPFSVAGAGVAVASELAC